MQHDSNGLHPTTILARSGSVEIPLALNQGVVRLLLTKMRWVGNSNSHVVLINYGRALTVRRFYRDGQSVQNIQPGLKHRRNGYRKHLNQTLLSGAFLAAIKQTVGVNSEERTDDCFSMFSILVCCSLGGVGRGGLQSHFQVKSNSCVEI